MDQFFTAIDRDFDGRMTLDRNNFSLKDQIKMKSKSLIGCPELKTRFKTQFYRQNLMPVVSDKVPKDPKTPTLGQHLYLPNKV